MRRPPFELDGAAAGFLEARARQDAKGLLLRLLVTAERHVDHDQSHAASPRITA